MRVLEDDLHPLPQRPQLGLPATGHLLALEPDRARRRRDQPEQGPPERRLARPRLADDAEHLAATQVEADAVDGA